MINKIIFLLILNLTLIATLLIGSAEESVEGVWTVRLRSCYLGYHTNIHASALACPGVDYIKLWPVEQPGQEAPDPDWLLGGYPSR